MMRAWISLVLALACFCCARAGFAIGAEECVKLHASGQDDRESGKLTVARSSFLQCAAEECPNVVREECARLLGLVDQSLPTLVFEAHDEKGNLTKDVQVSVDGKVLTEKLRATAIGIDPGEHHFSFKGPHGKLVTQDLTVLEGQKNRLIRVNFVEKPESSTEPVEPKPAPSRSVPAGAYILGGVAVVSLGAFGYFALSGRQKQSDLEDGCAPNCAGSEYDDMKQKYLFADIALGIAVVSGGIATWLVLDSGKAESRVGVRALPGGAKAAWEARF